MNAKSYVPILYSNFANTPYVSESYWTTNREFKLDSLYQHTAKQYEGDPLFEPQQHEFVLDTTFGSNDWTRTSNT
jgi:hypothetical protein